MFFSPRLQQHLVLVLAFFLLIIFANMSEQIEDMAAITTVINPLNTKKVMIFSTNDNHTLALENRNIGGNIERTIGTKDKPPVVPVLGYPATLITFVYDDSVN